MPKSRSRSRTSRRRTQGSISCERQIQQEKPETEENADMQQRIHRSQLKQKERKQSRFTNEKSKKLEQSTRTSGSPSPQVLCPTSPLLPRRPFELALKYPLSLLNFFLSLSWSVRTRQGPTARYSCLKACPRGAGERFLRTD